MDYSGLENSRDLLAVSNTASDWSGSSWYRFVPPAGTLMADSPPIESCGSDYGGWVDGGHPTTVGEVVRRNVCFKGYGETRCLPGYWSYHYQQETILIKNCGDFFSYYLTDTSVSWYGRYCGLIGGELLTRCY